MGIKLQKNRWIEVAPELYGNILVGLSFLALTFLTVKIFAPDVSSNADTNNASVEAGPYTMSISTDSLTSINITPTSSQAIYTGISAISYTNTCPHGFNVAMSSVSDNTSLTRTGSDSGAKEIPTISSGAALADNTWGFSKDNGSTYNAVPALANPATIIDTTSATTTATTLNLIYGVKTDNQLPSGSYSNDIVYTVSAKQQCLSYSITWNLDGGTAATGAIYPSSLGFGQTLDLSTLTPTKNGYEFTGWSNGTNTFDGTENAADINPSSLASLTMTAQWEQILPMQDFSCSALTNVGDSVKLRDARDDNIYTVKKLADGKCWMTQNLRLIDKTISSADSNLPEGETYTVPASDASSFITNDSIILYNTNSAYLDSTYGGYYNFYTATAGWGTNSVESGNSPKDICPKGWRLPTGGNSGEFQTLYNNYNSSALMRDEPNFTLSGYVLNGSVELQGKSGYFWSSTVGFDTDARSLYLYSSNVGPASSTNKTYGFSVRCIAEDITMQAFDSSTMIPNTGDSMALRDERDDNMYTIKRLADGKVWMTDNLRLIDKTISSADSNLPSGETWTVPASDVSSFTQSYNTNSAYLDSTYGGYYNFYTATAGWGTDSLESGNSPKDICPKGWRLPTGGDSGEFQTLYNNYNSDSLMMDALNLAPSGYVLNGSMHNQGSEGFFWSSTVSNDNYAYNLVQGSLGVYLTSKENKVKGFSVRCVAKDPEETVDRTISDITYMQDITSKIAKNTPIGAVATLTDIRDNNTYTVRKLKDGKIWMTENLRLINKTISSADSNLPEGETYTVPASNLSSFTTSSYNTNNAYLDSTYGAYYNFYTATAGNGGIGLKRGNVPSSICPKGWRLPIDDFPGDFNTLYNNYNSAALMMGVPNFTLSGYVGNGSVHNQGSYGHFWSSSVDINYDYNAYFMYLNNSDVVLSEGVHKSLGFSVRCVAEDRTISDITYMQDMTTKIVENTPINTVAILTDPRDYSRYTVRKLKDGKVWMTENLRIADKTINSADSNVTSDFTIPASSVSGFNEQDANNAYIDSTYGGYYTFYTATAGTGGTSLTSGNAPSSICPKGWRLPTGGYSGEFQILFNNYNSTALMQGDPKITLSGFAGDGSVYQQGSYGRFWSSAVRSANNAYDLYLDSSVVYPSYDIDKKHGFPVRCVAI